MEHRTKDGPPPVRLETVLANKARERGVHVWKSAQKRYKLVEYIFRYFAGEYPKSGL